MTGKSGLLKSLEDIFGQEKPLLRLINTSSAYYLYDTGTNKILACRKEIYHLIDSLMRKDTKDAVKDFITLFGETKFNTTAEEIIGAIKSENILMVKKATQFGMSGHFKNLKKVLRN